MNEKLETSENAQQSKNSFLDVSLKGLQKNPTKSGERADLMRKTRVQRLLTVYRISRGRHSERPFIRRGSKGAVTLSRWGAFNPKQNKVLPSELTAEKT